MRSRKVDGKFNIIGPNLMKYRKKRNLSLRELSDKLSLIGITLYHSDICKIESQEKSIKDFEVKALCEVLNITLDEMYENNK